MGARAVLARMMARTAVANSRNPAVASYLTNSRMARMGMRPPGVLRRNVPESFEDFRTIVYGRSATAAGPSRATVPHRSSVSYQVQPGVGNSMPTSIDRAGCRCAPSRDTAPVTPTAIRYGALTITVSVPASTRTRMTATPPGWRSRLPASTITPGGQECVEAGCQCRCRAASWVEKCTENQRSRSPANRSRSTCPPSS